MLVKRINLITIISILSVLSIYHVDLGARASESTPKIVGVKDNHFIDEFGRQRFFRGLNVVYKSFPYYPTIDVFDPVTSFTKEDMEILASVNMNIIRLGVLWAGVEPLPGKYNETYLNIIKGIADQ